MPSRRFGYFIFNENGTMDAGRATQFMSEEVWAEYDELVSVVTELRPFVIDFLSLEENWNEVAEVEAIVADQVKEIATTAGRIMGIKHIMALATAQRAISNFLSSSSSFRGRAETRLREKYGKESLELKRVQAAITDAYDCSFAYRLLYNLRNYEQHEDMPLSVIPGSGVRNAAGEMETKVSVELKPAALAKSNRVQKSFRKKELEQLTENIKLVPMCEEFMALHGEIMRAVIENCIARLVDFQAYARMIFAKMNLPPKALPVIFEDDQDDISKHRFNHFSFDELAFLGLLFERLQPVPGPGQGSQTQ